MSHLLVGLTGGIGSGKTQVSDLFAALGVSVIDADILARELVAPGMPALKAIRQKFGDAVLDNNGELNRRQLRERVFSDPEQKAWLDNLLHPLIRHELIKQAREAPSEYAILAVPLLVENQLNKLTDRTLVIDVEPQRQLERVVSRDRVSEQQVRNIISHQASREDRLAVADDVIDNNGEISQLAPQVQKLHEKYLKLAKINLKA
ncbi:dephospho-CoA kinase [Lacimicrobium alkaliphilum]|uniref:Dephospho-CoA kinase n=1 Tax=Lacimicrobium alkaliphilum TaxID=1526571 RepID=A0A0U2ZKV2_9ALTE|nr:dephospho-CoA kinase [Lacimicrobium alkaliphilum]ALS99639.1 dephospho-CoA kinase [Lacimicrobium alkaliphilum]